MERFHAGAERELVLCAHLTASIRRYPETS